MTDNRVSVDCSFELRNGEYMYLMPLEEAPFVVALFPVTTPGPMVNVSGTNEPASASRLVFAERIGDKFGWRTFGAGSHRQVGEWIRELRVEEGRWYGCRFGPAVASDLALEAAVASTGD